MRLAEGIVGIDLCEATRVSNLTSGERLMEELYEQLKGHKWNVAASEPSSVSVVRVSHKQCSRPVCSTHESGRSSCVVFAWEIANCKTTYPSVSLNSFCLMCLSRAQSNSSPVPPVMSCIGCRCVYRPSCPRLLSEQLDGCSR